ncbi:MAG: hypothetical protein ABIH87_04530 [bacterium]
MKEPTYEQAIAKAWQVVWHNKVLWVLGLLAAFLGQFGLGDFFGRVWLLYNKGTVIGLSSHFWQGQGFSCMSGLNWHNILGLVWLVGILIIILIAVVFLTVASQGALIAYTSEWFKNDSFTDFSKAWRQSLTHFWQVLGAIAIYKAVFASLLLLSLLLLNISDKAGGHIIVWVLGICLGIILFFYLIFSILYIYTLGYIVVDNNKFVQAWQKSWQLFSKHVLVSLEVGVVLMVVNLLLFVLIVSSMLLAFLPALIIWLVSNLLGLSGLAAFGFMSGLFLWILIVVLISSVYNAFNTGVWMYLFIKMHKQGIASRVLHWFAKLVKK